MREAVEADTYAGLPEAGMWVVEQPDIPFVTANTAAAAVAVCRLTLHAGAEIGANGVDDENSVRAAGRLVHVGSVRGAVALRLQE